MNKLDLTSDHWTYEDFNKNEIEVKGDLSNLEDRVFSISYKPISSTLHTTANIKDWAFSVITETYHKIAGNYDPKSIYNVRNALDILAKKKLNDIEHIDWRT